MVAGQNQRAWWAKRSSRSLAEILAIASLAGGLCAFVVLFLMSLMGTYAGVLPFLQLGRANRTNWYEVMMWIGTVGAGVLVFAKIYRSGAKSLPRRPESGL